METVVCQACQPWRLVPNYMSYRKFTNSNNPNLVPENILTDWQQDEIPACVNVTTCADTSKQGYPDILYNQKIFLQVLLLGPGHQQVLLLVAGPE